MKRRLTILATLAMAVLISVVLIATTPVQAWGAMQISGDGFFNDGSTCSLGDVEGNPDFVNILTGDLEGCFYVFVETAKCSSDGIYRERGTNLFVGEYLGNEGSFEATYQFMGKFEECNTIDDVSFPGGAEFFASENDMQNYSRFGQEVQHAE